ncbi:MAG: triose-phosphate isomerase [Flavobacteriales bacterium]
MAEKIVAGNWKMHLQLDEAYDLFAGITDASTQLPNDVRVLVIPPFPFIHPLYRELPPSSSIDIGAQNCHQEEAGAFTGEVSPPMLASVGATHCIVGHSERRRDLGESDELLLEKVRLLLNRDLIPILCLGESLEERESGKAEDRIRQQLEKSLLPLSDEELEQCVLAYEPIWAIGTGHTASPDQAQEMHAFIRSVLRHRLGEDRAAGISILYGGSCKAANAEALFAQKDIDGGLIGSASLQVEAFLSIIRSFP